MTIKIHPKLTVRFLSLIILALLLGNLFALIIKYGFHHDYVFGLAPMFDMDNENSIPTLFSSLLMIIISFLCALIAKIFKSSNKFRYYTWLGLAIIFLFLCIDEFVSIHEHFTDPVREYLNLSGLLYFSWIVPYTIIVAIISIIYLPFLLTLHRNIRWKIALATIIFLSGALGMESLGGYYFELNNHIKDVIFALLATIEEMLELSGLVIFIYALLSYINMEHQDLCLKVSNNMN